MPKRGAIVLACLIFAGCGSSDRAGTTKKTTPAAPPDKVVMVRVQGNPAAASGGFGNVWAVGHRNGVIYEIDPRSARVSHTIVIGGTHYIGLAAGDGAVWTYREDKSQLVKVDPETHRVVATAPMSLGLHSLIATPSGLWATAGDGPAVVRIDPKTLRFGLQVKPSIPVATEDFALASGDGAIWLGGSGVIVRLDPRTGRVTKQFKVSGPVKAIAVAPRALYYVRPDEATLFRVGLPKGRLTRVTQATSQPGQIAMLGDHVLVTDDGRNSVTSIDAGSGKRLGRLVLRRGPAPGNNQPDGIGLDALVLAGGAIWLPDWDANGIYRVPISKLPS